MNLENQEWQFVSLELSIKMKELGFKQKSLFSWFELCPGHHTGETHSLDLSEKKQKDNIVISAYTPAELGEILKEVDELLPWYANGDWWFYGKGGHPTEIKTEANARAKMAIYLKENKLI